MNENMTLGEYIRATRTEKGKSLTEFAGLVGKTPPFLHDIEMGRRYPSDEVLNSIAKHLGKSLKDLKQYDTRPPTDAIRKQIQSNPQFALAR